MTAPQVLIPWDREEATSLKHAAWIARRSETTLRGWAEKRHIGRRVAGGAWMISVPALLMLLEDDAEALADYLAGDRASERFRRYRTRARIFLPPELT